MMQDLPSTLDVDEKDRLICLLAYNGRRSIAQWAFPQEYGDHHDEIRAYYGEISIEVLSIESARRVSNLIVNSNKLEIFKHHEKSVLEFFYNPMEILLTTSRYHIFEYVFLKYGATLTGEIDLRRFINEHNIETAYKALKHIDLFTRSMRNTSKMYIFIKSIECFEIVRRYTNEDQKHDLCISILRYSPVSVIDYAMNKNIFDIFDHMVNEVAWYGRVYPVAKLVSLGVKLEGLEIIPPILFDEDASVLNYLLRKGVRFGKFQTSSRTIDTVVDIFRRQSCCV